MPYTCPYCGCEAGLLGCSNGDCDGIPMKKRLRWCSKHQVVHKPDTKYESCVFPNLDNPKG